MKPTTALAAAALSIFVVSAQPTLAIAQNDPSYTPISNTDVLQLCAAHDIKDVICDEARQIEMKRHKPGTRCWETNKC